MSSRDKTTQETKQALFDALERLKANQPTDRKLIGKLKAGKLKVNRSSVEKEADKSVGSLRNHPDVVDAITKFTDAISFDEYNVETVEDVYKEKLANEKNNKKDAIRLKEKYRTEADKMEASMENQLEQHHMITAAMFELIPLDKRKELIEKITKNNILEFVKK
jgi:hypothetical protein